MEIGELERYLEKEGIIFLTYGGFITQPLIVGMTEVLEREAEKYNVSQKVAINIFTVFVEITQNILHYALDKKKALILVAQDNDEYFIYSQNTVTKEDKENLEEKLKLIVNSTKDEIKEYYKAARRSGRSSHDKGGGIGLFEIAKRVKKMEYDFKKIDDNTYIYRLKVTL